MSSKSTSIGQFAGLNVSITPQFWIGYALLTGLIGLGLALFAALSPWPRWGVDCWGRCSIGSARFCTTWAMPSPPSARDTP